MCEGDYAGQFLPVHVWQMLEGLLRTCLQLSDCPRR